MKCPLEKTEGHYHNFSSKDKYSILFHRQSSCGTPEAQSVFHSEIYQIGIEMDHQIVDTKLYDLPTGCFEKIASYLDTRANLNVLFSNKKIYSKLVSGAFFWKHLCELEGLDEVSSLSVRN